MIWMKINEIENGYSEAPNTKENWENNEFRVLFSNLRECKHLISSQLLPTGYENIK